MVAEFLGTMVLILFGVGVLALGCVAFLLWSRNTNRWPFGSTETSEARHAA